jgi:hypothetical protein
MKLKDIARGMKVFVNDTEYTVTAKVLYVSATTGRKYWKIFLSAGGLIIYDCETEELICFGTLVNDLEFDFSNPPETVEYGGAIYKADGDMEYERVLNFEFGELTDAEGECKFANYSADDGGWISPGLISETGTRADYYGAAPSAYDIKFG